MGNQRSYLSATKFQELRATFLKIVLEKFACIIKVVVVVEIDHGHKVLTPSRSRCDGDRRWRVDGDIGGKGAGVVGVVAHTGIAATRSIVDDACKIHIVDVVVAATGVAIGRQAILRKRRLKSTQEPTCEDTCRK